MANVLERVLRVGEGRILRRLKSYADAINQLEDDFTDSLAHFRRGLACEPANPALCSDVLQLVDAVEKLERPRSGAPEEPVAGHILLSTYGRGLH